MAGSLPTGTGKNLLAILGKLLGALFQTDQLTSQTVLSIEGHWQALIKNVGVEVKRVKNFKFDPKWSSRVINVPKAIEAIKSLIEDLTSGLADKVKTIAQPFINFKAEFEAFTAFANAPREPGESRILAGYQEIQQFINALNTLIGELDKAVESAGDLTELFDHVLNDLETLDDLFLQQGNSRKEKKGTARIRLGKLHSSG
jgi:hypothetical protein